MVVYLRNLLTILNLVSTLINLAQVKIQNSAPLAQNNKARSIILGICKEAKKQIKAV